MLTIFALSRVPVVLAVFAAAWRHYRRKSVSLTAFPALLLPLAGLLITTAGDLSGNWFRACFVFGAAHLCWFAFLVRRGRFSWEAAGVLTWFLLPLLAAVVFPAVDDALEIAITWYAFCTVISVSAAVGARKAPGGGFYLAGVSTLMVSDVCIGLSLANIPRAWSAVIPLYVASLVILLVALVRGFPAPPPKPELAPPPVRQHRNALVLQWIGIGLPLLFLAAMLCYNGHYCWYAEYISESGLVFVKKHLPNRLSAWLLTSGLTDSALLCAWYFAERFRWGKGPLWQRSLILFFGVLGALGLAGIGGAPFDQHPDFHNFCTLCTVPFGIAIFFASLTPEDVFGRRSEKAIWLIFAAFIVAVVGGLTYLKQYGLPNRPTGPFIQKMTVLAFYIYMLGQVVTYARNTRPPRNAGSVDHFKRKEIS